MQLFAILGLSAGEGVLERIQEQFPYDHLEINPSTFFVACEGEVAKGLAEKLGIGTEKESGGMGISRYFPYWESSDSKGSPNEMVAS